MRVSASTPSVRITQSGRIFGCAAIARVGLTSSHRCGAPGEAWPSAIERHIWPHCLRAVVSKVRSLRACWIRLPICSFTVLSSRGFTSFDMLSLRPPTFMPPSAIPTWPERLGSIRQVGNKAGFDVTDVTRMSTRWSSARDVSFCISPPSLPPSNPPTAPVRLAPWVESSAGGAKRAVERGRNVQAGRGAVHHEPRGARHVPADFGFAEQFGERIFVLAGSQRGALA